MVDFRAAPRQPHPLRQLLGALLLPVYLAACGGSSQATSQSDSPQRSGRTEPPQLTPKMPADAAAPNNCPASVTAPLLLPGVDAAHRSLDYWLARTQDLDVPLLDEPAIADLNRSMAEPRRGDWHVQNDLSVAPDLASLTEEARERLAGLHEKLVAGTLVTASGLPAPPEVVASFDPAALELRLRELRPELRVALNALPLRCGPRAEPLFATPAVDLRFDRNNCSTIHPHEPVQLLAEWPGGLTLARTRYATGWIAAADRAALLSPVVPDALLTEILHGPRASLPGTAPASRAHCPGGTLVPIIAGPTPRLRLATATGFDEIEPAEPVVTTRRPLTRRTLLTEAFAFLDTPYGWGGGGAAGGHDCSSFVMDLFARFAIALPRHSSWQAHSGSFSIDLAAVASERERLQLIDAAARTSVVLLSFPGHVMLYLGRDANGAPKVLHAIAEYVTPCATGGETLSRIDRIQVSDLELGRGSSRRSLLERLTHVTLFGGPPGPDLAGVVEPRPAARSSTPEGQTCKDGDDATTFVSPRVPNSTQPMRVIVTASRDPGPVALTLLDPAGRRVAPTSLTRLRGGPPFSIIAIVDAPQAGKWTAILGDGERIEACRRFVVAARPPRQSLGARSATEPVWAVQRAWGRATENLYATFVQRLFDFPLEPEVTWPNLHALLGDPTHNLLFDHLQRGEDVKLRLVPDCADLPYLLRSYFAWKLGLPFAYHHCSRGSASRAPECREPAFSNLMPRGMLDQRDADPFAGNAGNAGNAGAAPTLSPASATPPAPGAPTHSATVSDVDAFARFWRDHVGRAVHAASGRSVRSDESSDYYPVPLTREALRPGTVYIDPYGHVLVLTAWLPQTTSYGILMAADAQPDGTVGRKRFWRGNFLFAAETAQSGPGFKAFRPAVVDRATRAITLLGNRELGRVKSWPRLPLQPVAETADAFYDSVEALINPRALEAKAALTALADALHQQARLRVISVANGEDWIALHKGALIAMPPNADIFLTSGPWEDFATPSRDLRLLIAIDAVVALPATVRRNPTRFGFTEGAGLDAVIADLEQTLDELLAARMFTYLRSDRSEQTVTLHELIKRQAALELGYNPNDCIEVRWGAPAASPEGSPCQRAAPPDQRARMEQQLRPWFHERRRPLH